MNTLQGKVIVITGGNSGMGYAAAQKAISKGANVIIVGQNEVKVRHAVSNLGIQATGYTANLSLVSEIDALFQNIKKDFSSIDGLFVNAGICLTGLLEEFSEEKFDQIVNTNFKGAFFTIQKALPLMRNGGSIVLNASMGGHRGIKGLSAYGATKAALQLLAQTLAVELGERKIRVNSVSPGTIHTPIYEKMGFTEKETIEFMGQLKQKIPLARVGQSDEIANVVTFLLSDDSSFINGTDILADGGVAGTLI